MVQNQRRSKEGYKKIMHIGGKYKVRIDGGMDGGMEGLDGWMDDCQFDWVVG